MPLPFSCAAVEKQYEKSYSIKKDNPEPADEMRKTLYIITTVFIMAPVSRFAVRIVDATVQIDGDIGLLIVMLVLLNAAIAAVSRRLYKRGQRGGRTADRR